MSAFTEDLWAIILVRLPLKNITTFKLVCKQWKSIAESPYFCDMFMSLHQNSHTSWSLMFADYETEFLARYRCDTWGLERSMGSYISSFLTNKFKTHDRENYRMWAYSDVGLILFSVKYGSLYVANPVSQECVKLPSHAHLKKYSPPLGIATRTENNVLLGYTVFVFNFDGCTTTQLSLLIYSSETGLWSLNNFPVSLSYFPIKYSISLQENIHWLATINDREEVIVSINAYATRTGSVQCCVTPFPDFGKNRIVTTCQGFLMYLNIISLPKSDGSLEYEDKLYVRKLISGEWQLVTELSLDFFKSRCDYILLMINPFDVRTVYLWSKKHHSLVSVNLHNGKFVLHSELERSIDGGTLSSIECHRVTKVVHKSLLRLCVFPKWLHRIPVKRV